MNASLDLAAYLARIAYRGDLQPSLSTLQALHLAHLAHIPFENLDIQLGRGIAIDLISLQKKLIADQRGGYCFEQNTLFAAALRQLGFAVTTLAARVRSGVPADAPPRPRTHMILRVEIEGEYWLADVGFGGDGILLPVQFGDGREVMQFAWNYRLIESDPATWLLQMKQCGAWNDFYIFTLEPQIPGDYEMANYFVSTHPDSRFVTTLTTQLATAEARYVLRNRELTIDNGDVTQKHTINSNEELLALLADRFGMTFPAGTLFPLR